MSTKSDRLRHAREAAGFTTATDAANRFGWKAPTYLGHENGSRGFDADTATAYARAFRVSPEFLLFGKQDVAPTEESPAQDLVPVYDVVASAGNGSIVDTEEHVSSLAFPPNYLRRLTRSHPRNLAIIGVKGDSMEPTLLDDDIVLLDTSKTNGSYDGLFVLRFDNVLQIKRLSRSARRGFVTVLSDNRALYPAFEAAIDDIVIVGKVLWYGRKV